MLFSVFGELAMAGRLLGFPSVGPLPVYLQGCRLCTYKRLVCDGVDRIEEGIFEVRWMDTYSLISVNASEVRFYSNSSCSYPPSATGWLHPHVFVQM